MAANEPKTGWQEPRLLHGNWHQPQSWFGQGGWEAPWVATAPFPYVPSSLEPPFEPPHGHDPDHERFRRYRAEYGLALDEDYECWRRETGLARPFGEIVKRLSDERPSPNLMGNADLESEAR